MSRIVTWKLKTQRCQVENWKKEAKNLTSNIKFYQQKHPLAIRKTKFNPEKHHYPQRQAKKYENTFKKKAS